MGLYRDGLEPGIHARQGEVVHTIVLHAGELLQLSRAKRFDYLHTAKTVRGFARATNDFMFIEYNFDMIVN